LSYAFTLVLCNKNLLTYVLIFTKTNSETREGGCSVHMWSLRPQPTQAN